MQELLVSNIKELNLEITDTQIEQFEKYYEMLVKWNEVMNLTAITEYDEVQIKHFVDSIMIVRLEEFAKNSDKKIRIIDIGTGAGFPGIPLKIMFPNMEVVLLDSLNKRVNFLNEVINELGLKGITAYHARAEELAKKDEFREKFDYVVSRAVANLATLSEYCIPYAKKGGYFIPYKSGKLQEEMKDAQNAIKILGGKVEHIEEFTLADSDNIRTFPIIKKVLNTAKKYPRGQGKPAKEPLK